MAQSIEYVAAIISVGNAASSIINDRTPINVLSLEGVIASGILTSIEPGTTLALVPSEYEKC
jgi:hypothetical protein